MEVRWLASIQWCRRSGSKYFLLAADWLFARIYKVGKVGKTKEAYAGDTPGVSESKKRPSWRRGPEQTLMAASQSLVKLLPDSAGFAAQYPPVNHPFHSLLASPGAVGERLWTLRIPSLR